jgi:hypothetical protein
MIVDIHHHVGESPQYPSSLPEGEADLKHPIAVPIAGDFFRDAFRIKRIYWIWKLVTFQSGSFEYATADITDVLVKPKDQGT